MLLRSIRVACLLVVVCLFQSARAQSSTMGYGMYDPDTSFKPEFSPRELTVVARVLRLSNDERAAVDTLYDGYGDDDVDAGSGADEIWIGDGSPKFRICVTMSAG